MGQHGHPGPHFKDVCKPTTIILRILLRQEGISILSRNVKNKGSFKINLLS